MVKDQTRTHHLHAEAQVINDVRNEIALQVIKWGYQEHPFSKWDIILQEELAEARTNALVASGSGYAELVQATAVLMSWLRDIKKHEIYKEEHDDGTNKRGNKESKISSREEKQGDEGKREALP